MRSASEGGSTSLRTLRPGDVDNLAVVDLEQRLQLGCRFGFTAGSMSWVREREIYPSAPIVLMAIEVRHSLCEALDRKQVAEVSAQVGHLLPLPSEMHEVSVTAVSAQTDPDGPPTQHQIINSFPRWTSRDKRTALSIRPDSLAIETTDYGMAGFKQDRCRGVSLVGVRSRSRRCGC